MRINQVLEGKQPQKVPASKPRNFVVKNQQTSGAGAHKDKKKAAKQGDVKHKGKQMDLAEAFDAEYDDEAGMADNNLETMKRAVQGIDDLIHTGDNLPEWCQEKIAVAKSMLVAVWDYMKSEEVSEATRNPDLMSPSDYDRYQQNQMDYDKRAFKRQELEHELGHEERGYYQVMIAKNGKWEYAKVQPRREGMNAAMDIIRRLHAK